MINVSLISTAVAAAAAPSADAGSPIPSILMMVVFMGLLYFVMIRPQQKRQKEQQSLTASLEVGDEVLLSGGLTGKIQSLDDTFLELQIAQGVTVKVLKSSVVKSFPKGTL
jgi:preprotein translocase subunit YajC